VKGGRKVLSEHKRKVYLGYAMSGSGVQETYKRKKVIWVDRGKKEEGSVESQIGYGESPTVKAKKAIRVEKGGCGRDGGDRHGKYCRRTVPDNPQRHG